jgi:hypothetical protein
MWLNKIKNQKSKSQRRIKTPIKTSPTFGRLS